MNKNYTSSILYYCSRCGIIKKNMKAIWEIFANPLTKANIFGIMFKRVSAKLNITIIIGGLFRHLEMYSSG